MVIRNEYKGDLALGKRIKTTAVASLDTITESAQTIADVVTTARSIVELVHGSLQPAIMEQRIEYAKTANQGVIDLVAAGMSKEDACNYLQIPFTASPSKSSVAAAAKAAEAANKAA